MGKRKRNAPTIEEVLERPWCYYCERDFDDLKVLIAHQKAKHYKCDQCNRRLNTAGGLSVHMSQVHKETLTQIENALPGRGDIGVEIFGMHGIPVDVLEAHKNRITSEYFKAVAERRAETGNPPPGTNSTDSTAKKPKIETPEEIRKRLAEHKAKREAEKAAKADTETNHSSSNTTPFNGVTPFNPPGAEVHSQQTVQMQNFEAQQYQGSPVQAPFPQGAPTAHPGLPGFAGPPPTAMSPSPGQLYAGPQQGMPPVYAASPNNGPPGMSPQAYAKPPAFAAPPPQHLMPMRPQHSFSPKQVNGGFQSPTITKQPDLPKAPSTLPAVPGLPSRPVVDAPSFSREDMARLHAGGQTQAQVRSPASPAIFSPSGHVPSPLSAAHDQAPALSTSNPLSQPRQSDHIDDLITSITNGHAEQPPAVAAHTNGEVKSPTQLAATQSTDAAAQQSEPRSKSSGKKSKHANTRTHLVYSDNQTSPEEKRALSKRYAFTRDDSTQYVLGDVGPAVTGAVRGPDDIMDSQSAH